jgi:hypothetical protein
MTIAKALLVGSLVIAVALSGCFGGAKQETKTPPPPPPEISKKELERFEQLAAPEIRNYTLPGSLRLEPQVKWFNGTIDSAANLGVQDRNDRGGNDFNGDLIKFDISGMVPVGQPTALRLKLVYFGAPGSSAKADIYVCVPGTCTWYTNGNNDEFNWKATVETMTVMTIGVSGETTEVGVHAANGKVATPLAFGLEVQASYFQDVLTPHHAYAFQVPQGATGVTLRSVKPGQEHLKAKFIVLDPSDQLVAYNEYDDIAILTESIFVPTRQPGEYVFYAQEMRNGFFSMVSDAPLENAAMRVLATQKEEAVDFAGGVPAVGVPGRDMLGDGSVTTPYTEGTKVSFSIDKGFPLEMGAFIKKGTAVTGAVQVQISSPKGLVVDFQRLLRVDTDQGSLGYTQDVTNTHTDWANLSRGAYAVSIVSDVETADIGHWVKSYAR